MRTECHKCGAVDHRASDCSGKKQLRDGAKLTKIIKGKKYLKQTKSSKSDWNRYMKKEERHKSSEDEVVVIRVSSDAVKNICSAGLMYEMGYGLQLMRVPKFFKAQIRVQTCPKKKKNA